MVVPNLSIDEQLNESHSSFDQSPCIEASPAIGIGWLSPDTIHFQRPRTLLREIQSIGGGQLHACRQLVAGDPRVELRLVTALRFMQLIETRNQIALESCNFVRLFKVALQVENRRTRRTKSSSLIQRRQIARLPVLRLVD